MAKQRLNWKKEPETEDFDGASNFLMLIFAAAQSKRLLRALRQANSVERAAQDLLRASNSPLLPMNLMSPRTLKEFTRASH